MDTWIHNIWIQGDVDIGYRSGYSDIDMDTGIYIYIYKDIYGHKDNYMDKRIRYIL